MKYYGKIKDKLDIVTKEYVDTLLSAFNGKFLSKLVDDIASGLITFAKGLRTGVFESGLTGSGAQIDGNGDAEMKSLTLRESLTVPELRFNRASLVIGTDIQSPCGGVIKSVTPDESGLGGVIELELGDDQMFGSVQVGALCWGYFHDAVNIVNNHSGESSDDHRGNILYKGFATVYFSIDSIYDTPANSSRFHYTLRTEAQGGNGIHPYPGMTFGGRGNSVNPDLRGFTITTPDYTATYQMVSSWSWDSDDQGIAAYLVEVRGRLDGFEALAGLEHWPSSPYYGTFGTNYWMRGILHQVGEGDRKFLYITQSRNGVLLSGDTETVTVIVRDNYFQNITADYTIDLNGTVIPHTTTVEGDAVVATYSAGDITGQQMTVTVTAVSGGDTLQQNIYLTRLTEERHIECFKKAVSDSQEEYDFTFDDNASIAMDDDISIGSIGEGAVIYALRYSGSTRVQTGYMSYRVNGGAIQDYTEGIGLTVEPSDDSIEFLWYDDAARERLAAALRIPVVHDGTSAVEYYLGTTCSSFVWDGLTGSYQPARDTQLKVYRKEGSTITEINDESVFDGYGLSAYLYYDSDSTHIPVKCGDDIYADRDKGGITVVLQLHGETVDIRTIPTITSNQQILPVEWQEVTDGGLTVCSGRGVERYVNVVRYSGQWYRCTRTFTYGTEPYPANPADAATGALYFEPVSYMRNVATDLFLTNSMYAQVLEAVKAKIDELSVRHLDGADGTFSGTLSAATGVIGGWVIGDDNLTHIDKDASENVLNKIELNNKHIYLEEGTGLNYARLATESGVPVLKLRGQTRTALDIQSYEQATCLKLQCNVTGGKGSAIDSAGPVNIKIRNTSSLYEQFRVGNGDLSEEYLVANKNNVKVRGLCMNTRTVSNETSADLLKTDDMVLVVNSSSAVTLNLPGDAPDGKVIYVKGFYEKGNRVVSSISNIIPATGDGGRLKSEITFYDDSYMFVKIDSYWCTYACN